MTKRRLLIGAAILTACVALAFAVVAMLPSQPGITKANFDRIEAGMSQAEVKAILGEPSDSSVGDFVPNTGTLQWNREDGTQIWVQFVADKSTRTNFHASTETIFDRVRHWLNLPT
jgi:hypothetical protein